VYKLNIPESDSYSTLGGFIVAHCKEIPRVEDVIVVEKYQFTIEKATNTKIEIVKLLLLE
jgi:CBS domain containing-hemolysin-like protein